MKKWFLFALFLIPTFAVADAKVVLVTGASKGIGKSICEKLADEGHTVYATMRTPERFDGFENPSIKVKKLDVTDTQEIEKVISEIVSEEKHLDVLVNNAGVILIGPCEALTMAEAKEQFDVNFFGAMSMMQGVLPQMREQKSGRIINISSTSGFDPAVGLDLYAASKGALESLSESMANYIGHFGIDISLIQPGPVKTDLILNSKIGTKELDGAPYEKFQAHLQQWYHGRLKRGQDPAEIGDLVSRVISQDKTKLRYQTSLSAVKRAQKNLVDITGCDSLTPKQVFANEMFDRPMDSSQGW